MSTSLFSNQVGYAEETTYGTRVAPTRFLDFTGEAVKRAQERRESAGIRAGAIVRRSDSQSAVPRGANGTVSHEIGSNGFGLLFKHMLRKTPTSTTPATGTRKWTFLLGTEALSLTCQVGRVKADESGVAPFDYLGAVVQEWTLSQELDAYLMLELTLDAQQEKTDQSLAAASYPASQTLFHDGELLVTVNGSQFDASKMELQQSNGLKLDRYFMRRNTLKKKPLNAEFVGITGSFDGEFSDLTVYNLFTAGTLVPIVFDWVGPQIGATGINQQLTVTLNSCVFDGETPETGGPGILDATYPFVAFDNGSAAPIQIDYTTSDTSI